MTDKARSTENAEPAPRVLIVDDQVGEIVWLLDELRLRGCETVVVSDEDGARRHLKAVGDGRESYRAAIFDVMVAVKDLWELIDLGEDVDEDFFADSRDTGIRLCRYARGELGLTAEELPIACLTVRDDSAIHQAMDELDIPLYHRIPESWGESIETFLDRHLPPRGSTLDDGGAAGS
jgi:hypothetical protein